MPGSRISWHARVPIEVATSMLEPTLGWDKSAEVVEETARELGISGNTLTLAQVRRIFESLGMRSDLVGFAARFARTRLEGDRSAAPSTPPGEDRPKSVRPSPPPPSPALGRWIAFAEVVDLFAPALGVDKSTSLVSTAASELGLVINQLDTHSALAIIDRLAKHDGLVGVVAKFAKAQLILKVTEEPSPQNRPPASETPPTARTGQTIPPSESDDAAKMEKLDQLAREAGVTWVEWLQEDFAHRKAELPPIFPETHHGARQWLMRSLPRASRERLNEMDIDRMVRILFESARRQWEGTASSRTDT
jgi:hypothetical protein